MGYTTEEHLAKATARIAKLEGVVKDREAALSVQTERAKAYKEDNAKLRRQLAAAGEEAKAAESYKRDNLNMQRQMKVVQQRRKEADQRAAEAEAERDTAVEFSCEQAHQLDEQGALLALFHNRFVEMRKLADETVQDTTHEDARKDLTWLGIADRNVHKLIPASEGQG